MAWDSYCDNMQGHCPSGYVCSGIMGQDGALWTTSSKHMIGGEAISCFELAAIAKTIKNNDGSTMQANGVTLAGVKWRFLREEDNRVFMFKAKDDIGAKSKPFFTIHKSNTALVFGVGCGDDRGANINKAVGVICEYLQSVNM